MRISEAFELYRDDYIVGHNQSAKTEENHFCSMNSLIKYCGDINIADLTLSDIRGWRLDMAKGKGSNTVRGYVVKLRVVLAYLQKKGHKVVDVNDIPVPKRNKTVREYVTPDELEAMVTACSRLPVRINRARNTAILRLLWSSGLRVEELCALTINQALLDDITIIGKSEEPRLCFIDMKARIAIDQYLRLRNIGYSVTSRGRIRSIRKQENERALFINNLNGNPITAGDVQLIVRNAARNAGLTKRVTPHIIRHGYATDLVKKGCDIHSLMLMMGHQNMATTAIYLHSANPHLKEQYQKYHTVT